MGPILAYITQTQSICKLTPQLLTLFLEINFTKTASLVWW